MSQRMLMASQVVYLPQSLALFARMTTPPSHVRKRQIDQTMRLLLGAGLLAKMDALYLMAAADSQAARLNWISNDALTGALGFVADRGFTTGGPNLTGITSIASSTSDSHVGVWMQAWSAQSIRSIDVRGGTTILPSDGGNLKTESNNSGVDLTAQASGLGHTALSRNSTLSYVIYKNGVSLATKTATASGSSGTPTLIGGDAGTMCAAHHGFALTGTDHANLYSALQVYLHAVGAV